MHGDPVKYELWGFGLSLSVALACAFLIVLANGSSRNLGLGLGALVGAVVLFAVQMLFELRGATASEDIFIEAMIDYQTKSVRSVQPNPYGSRNAFIEAAASKELAGKTPPLTADAAPIIVRDLAVLSVLHLMFLEQQDWQVDLSRFKTVRGGETRIWTNLSKKDECSSFSAAVVREKLLKAGNIFADALSEGIPEKICLPPGAKLDVTANSVIITNDVYRLTVIFIEPFLSMTSFDPASPTAPMPKLADGSMRFRNVMVGGRITTEVSDLHAQARDLPKYQAWSKRLSEGLKDRLGNT